MCFKQEGAISTLRGKPVKLVDQFTSLSSNISSTESDLNTLYRQVIDQMNIWSHLQNKAVFLLSRGRVNTIVWMQHIDSNETHGQKARSDLDKNVTYYFEQTLKAATYLPSRKPFK